MPGCEWKQDALRRACSKRWLSRSDSQLTPPRALIYASRVPRQPAYGARAPRSAGKSGKTPPQLEKSEKKQVVGRHSREQRCAGSFCSPGSRSRLGRNHPRLGCEASTGSLGPHSRVHGPPDSGPRILFWHLLLSRHIPPLYLYSIVALFR